MHIAEVLECPTRNPQRRQGTSRDVRLYREMFFGGFFPTLLLLLSVTSSVQMTAHEEIQSIFVVNAFCFVLAHIAPPLTHTFRFFFVQEKKKTSHTHTYMIRQKCRAFRFSQRSSRAAKRTRGLRSSATFGVLENFSCLAELRVRMERLPVNRWCSVQALFLRNSGRSGFASDHPITAH